MHKTKQNRILCACAPPDYRLLEELQRADDVAKRCRPPFPKAELPPHLSSLIYQAHRRHIDMRLMNPGAPSNHGCFGAWPDSDLQLWGGIELCIQREAGTKCNAVLL